MERYNIVKEFKYHTKNIDDIITDLVYANDRSSILQISYRNELVGYLRCLSSLLNTHFTLTVLSSDVLIKCSEGFTYSMKGGIVYE